MKKKLCRNEEEKMLAGVCSGLADYFLIDVSLVRIAFLLTLVAAGLGALVYVAMWIAVPPRFFDGRSDAEDLVTQEELNLELPLHIGEVRERYKSKSIILGLFLVIVGSFFLLDELDMIPHWLTFAKICPLIIIAFGILIIIKSNKKDCSNSERHPIKHKQKIKPKQVKPES